MASVSGSVLEFFAPHGKAVNLILTDGSTVTGEVIPSAFNIEIFTASSGSLVTLPGVDATATIEGAVTVSGSEVQAATLGSVEDLGTGAFMLIDKTGGEEIELGTGAQTVIGSKGDTIVGGNAGSALQVIDLTGTNDEVTAGPMTAIGGAGSLFVEAGDHDSISGGGGSLIVMAGSFGTIAGGSGSTTVFGGGPVSASEFHPRDGMDFRDTGDTFGPDTVIGGSGPVTVFGGDGDSIIGGSGTLLVDISAQSKIHGSSPSTAGSGSETIDLGAGTGAATLRDISVPGGTGPLAATTVTGFSTVTDVIASKTSVSHSGEFLGTSSVSAGNTTLTFTDGSTMTLVGITNVDNVTFTR
jgi:hypothetical protein